MKISEDKKIITLEVPLGSMIYEFRTRCCDACSFQKEKFKKEFSDRDGCNHNSPCHTEYVGTHGFELNMNNLGYVLSGWRKDYFPTEKEAEEAGKKLVEDHIKWMTKHGFYVKEQE